MFRNLDTATFLINSLVAIPIKLTLKCMMKAGRDNREITENEMRGGQIG